MLRLRALPRPRAAGARRGAVPLARVVARGPRARGVPELLQAAALVNFRLLCVFGKFVLAMWVPGRFCLSGADLRRVFPRCRSRARVWSRHGSCATHGERGFKPSFRRRH